MMHGRTQRMPKYTVGLCRYPVEVIVEAESSGEAMEKAKDGVGFSVWSIEFCDEVLDDEEK